MLCAVFASETGKPKRRITDAAAKTKPHTGADSAVLPDTPHASLHTNFAWALMNGRLGAAEDATVAAILRAGREETILPYTSQFYTIVA